MKLKTYAMAIILGVALFHSSFSARAAQKNSKEPVKMYIFTAGNDAGFVDADQKQRRDSVQDIRNDLEKKDLIQLVSAPEQADVTLEVLGRDSGETTTTTSSGGFGSWSRTRGQTEQVVRVGLKVGDYKTVIEGFNDGRKTDVWRTAAGNAAKKIDQWTKDNHDRVISMRKPQ